ncbi:hypothetical protein P43SY_001450 [Pythium insidiosum]|uniref:Calx-beta domain-containing protein n=1 Tax=Pythium insidiosum TaxID=114742 RepID=A0AAD5Q9E3_PYTIN|nr:hypothetical protein P43SY_001450 [Pythium insidiosum]
MAARTPPRVALSASSRLRRRQDQFQSTRTAFPCVHRSTGRRVVSALCKIALVVWAFGVGASLPCADAKKLSVLVQPVTSVAGEALALAPVVALTDDAGNILTTVSTGTVRATIGVNPSRFATVQPAANQFSFVNGIAKCDDLIISTAATGYTLLLVSFAHGVRAETAAFDVIVGEPYQLAVAADVSTAFGGTPFLPQPAVAVVDRGGNIVRSLSTGTATIEIIMNPVDGKLLPAQNLQARVVNGVATFSGLYIDRSGSPYALMYTVTGVHLPGGDFTVTNPFTVAAGVCTDLVLKSWPVEATGGKAFGVQPVLQLIDAGGNVLLDDSSSYIRASIASNPSGGALTPVESVRAYVRRGVAIFRSLKIDRAGNDYALAFKLYVRAAGQSGWQETEIERVSPPFNVIVGRPVTLFLLQPLSDGVLDGQPSEVQPQLELRDSGGNVVSSVMAGIVTASMVPSAAIASTIVVDTTTTPALSVLSVQELPTTGYPKPYGVGMRITIEVSFTDEVIVLGEPTLQLASSTTGGPNGVAKCITINKWSDRLVFQYDVVATDRTTDLDYASTTALSLSGGSIRDRLGRAPSLTLPAPGGPGSLAVTSDVSIDTTPPTITSVSCAAPGNGDYGAGEEIYIRVTFSTPVSVYGAPVLPVALGTIGNGALRRDAVFSSGNNTDTLVFVYVVLGGDATAVGGWLDVTSMIVLAPDMYIKRYSTRPTTDADLTMMSHEVFVDPPVSSYPEKAPELILTSGAFGRSVLCTGYHNGDRRKLLFQYTVVDGDVADDVMYVDEDSLTLNNGQSAIKRFSTTPKTDAILTLPPPVPLGQWQGEILKIDTTKVPTVVSVTASTPNGDYRCGDAINLVVQFSQHVVVQGRPFLWLDLGAVYRQATYQSGSGTTSLIFRYVVQEDDYSVDLEYIDHHSLDASDEGSAILHLSTTPTTLANLDLPYPFTQNSLSFNKNLAINGRKPLVTQTRFVSADGVYGVNQRIVIEVTFSWCVLVVPDPLTGAVPLIKFHPVPVGSTADIKRHDARNDYGPVIDTSGNLPALVPVTSRTINGRLTVLLKGTNARLNVQVGGYELPPIVEGKTHWGLPGDNAGNAAVFVRAENDWKQQGGALSGSDTRAGDRFGSSVSLKGDAVLIGAPSAALFGEHEIQNLVCDADGGFFRLIYRGKRSDPISFNAGPQMLRAAIVSIMSVNFADIDVMTVKFTPPANLLFDAREYAHVVALEDTFAAIGAPGSFDEEGRVFVYQYNSVTASWSLFQILSAAPYDITRGDRFGDSVAISGDPATTLAIAVGAPGYASSSGAVFVFDLLNGRFQNRQFILQVTPELRQGDRFGCALDLDMTTTYTLVVGAKRNAYVGLDSGTALVFTRRIASDTFFNLQQVLFASDARARDLFGLSVAISKDTIIVSTTSDFVLEDPDETVPLRLSLPGVWPSYGGNLWATLTIKDNGDGGSGSRSYLDFLTAGQSSTAHQTDSLFGAAEHARLVAPDGNPGDLFGASIALSGEQIIVGSPGSGALPTTTWDFETDYKLPGSSPAGATQGDGPQVLKTTGTCTETMDVVTWDLTPYLNRTAQIRVVDATSTEYWGHINFDDVQFSWDRKDCFDYQQTAGEITFAAGEQSKQILIPIMDDTCYEGRGEYFVVRLNVPGGEALIGEQFVTKVRIDDDDWTSDPC